MKSSIRLLLSGLMLAISLSASAASPSEAQRASHVLNRLAYGPTPGDIDRVASLGVERYIDEQLHPESIPLPEGLTTRLENLQGVNLSAGEALAAQFAARKAATEMADNKVQARAAFQHIVEQTAEGRLLRAIESPRQLEEVMVDFWFNHFNVFAGKGLDRALVASYERDAIRPNALGHFRDLLGATAHHPAMLFYLDNWLSIGATTPITLRVGNQSVTGLNENYARELMELHTLGVDGGYQQKDVTELARIMTGWTFSAREMVRAGGGFRFDPRRHDQADKTWLGHHVAARGREEGEWALDVLAQHPATAHHISYKLAQYFVADKPDADLVDRLSRRFTETHGDIRAVLATLFASPQFWDTKAAGTKFKTPYQYVVSSVRASGMTVLNVRPLLGTLAQLGMPLYGCQTPDGYKNTEDAWLNPDALTRRINFATALASGRLPLTRLNEDNSAAQTAAASRTVAIDAVELQHTLGTSVSNHTRETVAGSEPALRSALLLGSPDFMRH